MKTTVEYRMEGVVAMLAVVCLPLFCMGYGAVFAGRILSERLRKERQRRRCEQIREQRMKQRIALQKARENEQRGEQWRSLRYAKRAMSPISPPSAQDAMLRSNSNHPSPTQHASLARISVLKNNDFENTDTHLMMTGEEMARQWERTHDSLSEMVRFGLMLLEIEEAVDSSLIIVKDDKGMPVIAGRNPGVRGWLAEHCPHIGYKTAMRYKSLARKALQSQKGEKLVAKNETVYALQESLYADLEIPHCRLEKPRAKRKKVPRALHRRGEGCVAYQSLVFATRTRAHDTLRLLSAQETQRLGAAFLSLGDDLYGAS